MGTTLIVSDTHGSDYNLIRAFNKEKPVDKIVHMGDLQGQENSIESMLDCPCFMVKGNCDAYSSLPVDNVIMIGKERAFMTHGHYYGVDYGHDELIRHAKACDCTIALYGHTHIPVIVKEKGILVMNPGSLTRPRQPGRQASYIVAKTDESGETTFSIRYLD